MGEGFKAVLPPAFWASRKDIDELELGIGEPLPLDSLEGSPEEKALFAAIIAVCSIKHALIDRTQARTIMEVATRLHNAGVKAIDLGCSDFNLGDWWLETHGSRPSPRQILQHWTEYEEEVLFPALDSAADYTYYEEQKRITLEYVAHFKKRVEYYKAKAKKVEEEKPEENVLEHQRMLLHATGIDVIHLPTEALSVDDFRSLYREAGVKFFMGRHAGLRGPMKPLVFDPSAPRRAGSEGNPYGDIAKAIRQSVGVAESLMNIGVDMAKEDTE